MSPYCSAHNEWMIMKLCMCVGYHDAKNVTNFGGDPIKFLKRLKKVKITDLQRQFSLLLQSVRGRAASATRTVTASRLWSAMPVKHL